MTAEEATLLIEGWLRATPTLTFKQVRTDAARLSVAVTPRQYGEAKRRLGITGAPPRPAASRQPQSQGNTMNGTAAAKTPLMSFIVEFLRNKQDASYQDVRTAGLAAGFQVAPINYGNARKALGLSGTAPPRPSRRRRRIRQQDDAAAGDAGIAGAPRPSGRGRRGRKKPLDLGNLSNLVTELQEVVAERDRLLAALDQISAIVRSV